MHACWLRPRQRQAAPSVLTLAEARCCSKPRDLRHRVGFTPHHGSNHSLSLNISALWQSYLGPAGASACRVSRSKEARCCAETQDRLESSGLPAHVAAPSTSTNEPARDHLAHVDTRPVKMMAELPPRPLPWLLPAAIVPVAAGLIAHPLLVHTPHSFPALEISAGFSLLAFIGCLYVVPALGPAFAAKGLSGRDMLKSSGSQVCVVAWLFAQQAGASRS